MTGQGLPGIPGKCPVKLVKAVPHLREMETQVCKHIGILRTFSGKKEGNPSLFCDGFIKVKDSTFDFNAPALWVLKAFYGMLQLFNQVFDRGGNDCQKAGLVNGSCI